MKLYAVFGNPIAHSKSPYLHNFTFEKLGIDARYVRFKLENASNFRELFFDLGLSGANITVPFKEILLESCDEVVGIAQKIGAINTIVRRGERLLGHNTDAMGFYKNIERDKLKTALIIGAGGSAKAIAVILKERGIKVSVINRSSKRLEFFKDNGFECAEFGEFYGRIKGDSRANRVDFRANQANLVDSWANRDNLSANLSANPQYDLIINATSSSISDELPLDSAILGELFKGAKIAFDLMYGKKCPFLELAKKCGGKRKRGAIRTIDGANMLLYQAIYASSLFLDKPYHTIAKAMSPAWR